MASVPTKGAISIRNVTKIYDPGGVNVMAVEDCSLEIAPGDEVSLRVLRDGRLVVTKHFVELRAQMAGEAERSVLRTGGLVRIKHRGE